MLKLRSEIKSYKKQTKQVWTVLPLVIVFILSSCSVQYSFTGINTEARTVYINNFIARVAGGPPSLGQNFTETLKEYYLQNSPLNLAFDSNDGQLWIEGEIVNYQVTPLAPVGGDQAAQNRLTIAVDLDFTNTLDDEKSFERQFSFYRDFDASVTLAQIEDEAIEEIFEQIAFDIFNATLSDW